jgi:hypothetical protein
MLITSILLAAAAIIFVAKLTWDMIFEYIQKAEEIPEAKTCKVIQQKLKNGDYKIVANVFSKGVLFKKKLDSKTWEVEEMDDELKEKFGRKRKIIYDLRG